MDEKEMDLEEEIEETVEDETDVEDIEEAEYVEETVDESGEERDEEFEFELDEDGNVIIPGDDAEEPAPEPEADKQEAPEANKEPDAEIDAFRERAAKTESEYEELMSQVRDTLKKLGVDEKDALRGLAQLAADADDVPIEEYLKKRTDDLNAEKASRIAEAQKYEAMAASDLAELKGVYPEFKDYKSLTDMPRDVLMKFARFRDLGLSAKEAYSAANPDGIRAATAEAAKASAKNDNKSHLRSSVPKGANVSAKVIPKEELESWMEDLGVSREEAIKLYLKTKQK